MDARFVVVGTVRNVAKSIEREIEGLRDVLSPLGTVNFFVVESDSWDSTSNKLQNLKNRISAFDFVSLGALEESIPNRIERLIYCRNIYHTEIRTNPQYLPFQYVIVVDMDRVSRQLSTKAIKNSLEQSVDWAGLFANQSGKYYDLLALRHKVWCPNNVFTESYWLRNYMSPRKANQNAIYRRMIRISKSSPLIPVESAFGGFAIYKKKYFDLAAYTPTYRDDSADIDHVIFNRRISEHGGYLFIDPQLINGSWNPHSLSSFAIFRMLSRIKRSTSKLLKS